MAHYKSSEETKNKILEACRELFYKKGYVATTYQDLSEKLNISKGLINYHFPSKKQLASIVFEDFINQHLNFITALIGDKYSLQLTIAIAIRNYMNLFFIDQNMKKFYYEICKDHVILDSDSYKKNLEYYFQQLNNTYCLNIGDSNIKIYAISSAAAEVEVNLNYFDGYIDESYDNIVDFNIKMTYELLSIDYKQIDEIVETSREIFSKMEIRMKDYFQLELVSYHD